VNSRHSSPQILALAGVFQATELVRQAAQHGTWSGYAATASLDSLFRLESDSVEDIFGSRERLRLGLETLAGVLSGEAVHGDTLQHAVALLQLQRKFSKNGVMMNTVGEGLERIEAETAQLEEPTREERRAEEVAQLYTETISTLTPRVVVNGNPRHLQNPRTVAWIRTLLFAGLRSAVLWGQLGGGRFNLLFGRRKLLAKTEALLQG
jgi:high frequency lysogenization protein